MDDVNPSLMRPSGGDLRPESIPVTSQAQSLKRQGDGSLSDEQLLKRKRAVLKYAPLDPSGIFLGKRPRQITFIPRESDKGDILLDKFEPDSVNWYVPSKAKENKIATMGATACDRESLEAFRKTVELMAMKTEESHGCIYFKWNIEFVTSAEHEEQKRALLRTESQPKPNLPKIEPAMTQPKPAQPEPVVNLPNAPVAPVQPVVGRMTPTVAQPKPDLTPKPATLFGKPSPLFATLFAKPPTTQSKPDQPELKPHLPQPKVTLPTTEPIGKIMPTEIQPQLKPNLETAVTRAKPTVTQGTPALSQPQAGALVSPGLRHPTPIAVLEDDVRRAGGPCASCNNPNHVVAVCPCPTDAPFGAIPFCPVHNSRTHSFDKCEQTQLRIVQPEVVAQPEPNAGSNPELPARRTVINDVPYFIHYLIKNRVNRPPILSEICWLSLVARCPVQIEIADPRGFPWTKEFSRMIRRPYVFEDTCSGKVHWSRWDPNRHQNGNLPVDPALRYEYSWQIKPTAQIRRELLDGRLKSQSIVDNTD
ncbi:hypothetical protein QBC37DRAFT_400838 [Rhypophila decipiens]|uniref:Uncharacterized protein n=1 Tax=Rhypophila decipiens TaxID=261697 RepID=A0AAN7B9L4_9PEZI|nr:hypothetical protein QBC37DRAFT_400838 [Rhypophila decipiens]